MELLFWDVLWGGVFFYWRGPILGKKKDFMELLARKHFNKKAFAIIFCEKDNLSWGRLKGNISFFS